MSTIFPEVPDNREMYETTPPRPERPSIEEFILARVADTEKMLGSIRYGFPMVEFSTMLKMCQNIRDIVEWHKNWPVLAEGPISIEKVDPYQTPADSVAYRASQQISWMTDQEYRLRFGSAPVTAPLLRKLAANYATHPDYNPEWA